MSDSSRPHGLQPTRLLHPWDFPGKSTGVGCHCLLRNVRLDTIKPLEEDIGRKLSDINHNTFFDPSPRIMEIKAKISKWNLLILKSFCTTNETIKKKRQPTDW